MTVDLTGVGVTNIRDWPSVVALVGSQPNGGVRGGEFSKGDKPPCVVIVQLGGTLNPFGNTRRAGLQQALLAARCYGLDYKQAAQVAGAVIDAINLRGPRRDSQGRYIALSLVEGFGDATKDPDDGWPYVTVTFSLTGAAAAVA